ncbi:CRISPR-associated protein Csx16 [Sutterella wadsworthensis]
MKAAAEVCERGARFFTLELSLRPELRSRELGADEMNQLECRLVEYKVLRCAPMCAEEI